jgi:predicted RNA binding protein YcfA (HicA-like mRNA interferase family)
VKRNQFLKILASLGVELLKHGANHDIYIQRASGKKVAVPRHGEIENEFLRIILKEIQPQD